MATGVRCRRVSTAVVTLKFVSTASQSLINLMRYAWFNLERRQYLVYVYVAQGVFPARGVEQRWGAGGFIRPLRRRPRV